MESPLFHLSADFDNGGIGFAKVIWIENGGSETVPAAVKHFVCKSWYKEGSLAEKRYQYFCSAISGIVFGVAGDIDFLSVAIANRPSAAISFGEHMSVGPLW